MRFSRRRPIASNVESRRGAGRRGRRAPGGGMIAGGAGPAAARSIAAVTAAGSSGTTAEPVSRWSRDFSRSRINAPDRSSASVRVSLHVTTKQPTSRGACARCSTCPIRPPPKAKSYRGVVGAVNQRRASTGHSRCGIVGRPMKLSPSGVSAPADPPRDAFDLIVVGGGIMGAWVARDAAARGMRVALFEQGDIAGGTSSRTSKLVHGGLRYLEQGAFGLVAESARERAVWLRIAPHLVRPLPFLFPIYRGSRRHPWM